MPPKNTDRDAPIGAQGMGAVIAQSANAQSDAPMGSQGRDWTMLFRILSMILMFLTVGGMSAILYGGAAFVGSETAKAVAPISIQVAAVSGQYAGLERSLVTITRAVEIHEARLARMDREGSELSRSTQVRVASIDKRQDANDSAIREMAKILDEMRLTQARIDENVKALMRDRLLKDNR